MSTDANADMRLLAERLILPLSETRVKLQKVFNLPETEDSDTLREYTNLKCAENKTQMQIPTAEIEKSKSLDARTPM